MLLKSNARSRSQAPPNKICICYISHVKKAILIFSIIAQVIIEKRAH